MLSGFCWAYKTVSKDALNIIANLIRIEFVLKQRAIEYYVKHGIQTDAFYEYFREMNFDLNNVQKSFPYYKLPHPASTRVLDIRLEEIESLSNEDQTIVFTFGSKIVMSIGPKS